LQLAKSLQGTKEVIANRLFVSNIKSLDVTHLLDDSMKTFNSPMVIMDSLEGFSRELLKGFQVGWHPSAFVRPGCAWAARLSEQSISSEIALRELRQKRLVLSGRTRGRFR